MLILSLREVIKGFGREQIRFKSKKKAMVRATISVIRSKYNRYIHKVVYKPTLEATTDTNYVYSSLQERLEQVETFESTLSILKYNGEIRQVEAKGRERIYEVLV
jgi:hypothetical protein